ACLAAFALVLATPGVPAEPRPPWRAHGLGCHGDLAAACCAARAAAREDDGDRDGLPDACEQAVAERFAPIVYHSSDESNLPTNVDRLLEASRLAFYDDACSPDLVETVEPAPAQAALLGHRVEGSCGAATAVRSDATRSAGKQRTFFLADVPRDLRG